MPTIVDEYARQCLSIDVGRSTESLDPPGRLAELFVQRGTPQFIRSDKGGEFTAQPVRGCLERLEVQTVFIEPGSPWDAAGKVIPGRVM